MDYCNTVLAGAPRTVTDKLQRALNAAARVVTGTQEFDRGLGQILHDQLHWLGVPDRVLFKLAMIVHQCLNGRAPPYLSEHCIPVSSADTQQHLRSANRHLLAVPRFQLNTYGRPAFSVAGPMARNALQDFVRDPTSSTDSFRSLHTRSSAIAEGPRDASCQLKSCQLPRNSAETTYTTSPDQIDCRPMKLEI